MIGFTRNNFLELPNRGLTVNHEQYVLKLKFADKRRYAAWDVFLICRYLIEVLLEEYPYVARLWRKA